MDRRSYSMRAILLSPLGALAVAAIVALPLLGSRGMYDPTEGRYALCAREMLDSSSWLIPTLEGEPHWSKPPLAYWAIALGQALLGIGDAGTRLPNAIAFLLTVLAVALLGRSLLGRRAGAVAGLIYATSPFPALMAWGASTDTLLTMFETIAVLAAARAVDAAKDLAARRSANWIRACYLALGLAFLTKGPVAFIALVPIVILLRRATQKPPVRDLLAIALGLFAAVSWYVAAAARDPAVLDYWFHHELVDRTISDTAHRNALWYKPFIIYLPPLVLGAGVWLAALFLKLPATGRIAALRDRVKLGGRFSVDRFLLWWTLLPLVLLSLSQSRLPLYVLPLFPACALYLAPRVAATIPARGRSFRVWLAAAVALLLVVKVVWSCIETDHDMTRLAKAIEEEAAGADVLVYHEDELYGLTFELGRRFLRVADVEDLATPMGKDGSVDDAVKRVIAGIPGPSILVSRERRHEKIEAALSFADKDAWRVVHSAGWDLYLATQKSGS